MRNTPSRRPALLAGLVALAAIVATCTAPTATGVTPYAVTLKAKQAPTRINQRAAVRSDTTAPTKPSTLRVVSTTQSTITISWRASTDRRGVAGYTLFRNEQRVGSTQQRSFTYASLHCGTSYLLGVRAYDAAGNRSARAVIVAATTACSDTQPPTQPESVWQVDVTSTSVTLAWRAAADDFGVIAYEILSDGNLAGSTATTQYAVSGLACGTMHTLGVRALDAAGNRSTAASVLMATSPCPDSAAPSTPGQLVVRGSNETSVTVSWPSSSDNVGVVGYQLYRDGTAVGSTATSDYTVSGLACGKSYRIEVDAYDAAGNRSGKSARSVTTKACPPPPPSPGPADTTPPSAPTGVTVTSVTSSSIAVGWTASADNVGVTGYGLYRDGAAAGSSVLTNATFSGLVCGRSYQLAIDAKDANGNRSAQAGVTASTSPCPDTQAPSVPTALTQAGATETTAWISWSASTDNVGVAGYGVYVAGVRVASTSSRAYTFTALGCGSTYTVGVDAYDAAGIRSARADVVVTTSACQDTSAPSTPSGLTTSGVTASSVSLAWNASSDNVAVTGYGVYRAGVRIDSSNSRSYNFTGLTCGTTYALGVDAVDASGNRSARAATNATTSACPSSDTQAPSVPQGMAFGATSQTTVALSWNASTDNVGVAGYRLLRNGSGVATVATPGYTFSGLTCGTAYTFALQAYDAAGNSSAAAEATGSTSTAACSGGPPPPPPPPTQPPPTQPPPAGTISVAPGGDLNAAYSQAKDGTTIQLAAGDYGVWKPAGGSKRVTVKGVSGTRFRQLYSQFDNIVFDGLDIDAGRAKTSDGAAFESHGDNATFRNGRIGNVTDEKGALISGDGFTFDNVVFHDVYLVTPSVHNECVYAIIVPRFTIRNSTFRNCVTMDLAFTYGDWWTPLPPQYGNVTVENNSFGRSVYPDGVTTHGLGMNIGRVGPSGQGVMNGWTIRNNWFENNVGISPSLGTGNVFCGNTGKAPSGWQVACG